MLDMVVVEMYDIGVGWGLLYASVSSGCSSLGLR